MPKNETHNREETVGIQEKRNYVAAQEIQLEVRAAAEGGESRTIGGYAVKYNTPVVITDRWGDKYLEEIAAGCFDESLSRCKESGSEIKALWNHDTSRPLGNTKTDTLRFNTGDTTGLNYDIDLPNNTWGNDVRESVQRGDVDGSSFRIQSEAEQREVRICMVLLRKSRTPGRVLRDNQGQEDRSDTEDYIYFLRKKERGYRRRKSKTLLCT